MSPIYLQVHGERHTENVVPMNRYWGLGRHLTKTRALNTLLFNAILQGLFHECRQTKAT